MIFPTGEYEGQDSKRLSNRELERIVNSSAPRFLVNIANRELLRRATNLIKDSEKKKKRRRRR